jgi:hypothetical protein
MKYPLPRLCPAFKVGALLLGLAAATSSLVAAVTINLTPSRTSGVAPLAVYFDAGTTTATNVSHPMHNLSFEWDFGDPGSGTWAISGQSKNFATAPAAAHVFKTPGTYQVTVAVTDGASQSSSQTVTITVTDPNSVFAGTKTICFSPDGNFTGAAAGAQLITTNSMATVLSHAGPNRRLLLKRGASFTSATNTVEVAGPGILGSFGPASAPPRLVGSTATFLYWKSTDWRILDLEFQGNGLVGTAAMQMHAPTADTLVMNTRVVPNTVHAAISSAVTAPEKMFIVENEWRDTGFTEQGGCIIYMMVKRLALLGNVLDDGSGAEHVVRLVQCEKGVISHNYFARPKELKSLLTIRSKDGGETHEVFVSDNVFVSWTDGHLDLISKNAGTHTVYGRDFIIERNFFKRDDASPAGANQGITVTDADNVTIRNNVIFFNGWGYCGIRATTSDNVWVYNNSAYSPDTSTKIARFVDFDSGTNHVAKNNLWYAPGLTYATPLIENPTIESNNLKATANPYAFSTITAPEHFVLSATSAARNAGTAVTVFEDYDLNPRPSGSAWDIGAFESPAASTWTSQDIGSPALAGSHSYNASTGTFTVNGAGADIWASSDQFHFVTRSTPLVGNGTITARLVSQTNPNGWAKAGVMIRDGLAANAKNAAMLATPTGNRPFQYRVATGGTTASANLASSSAVWLRLTRSGNTFTAFHSPNGTTWTQVGAAQTITMGTDVRIGLCVTSHNTAALGTAVFDNITITP